MKIITILPLTLLFIACQSDHNEIVDMRTEEQVETVNQVHDEQQTQEESKSISNPITPAINSTISYKIIENDHGYGYQIFQDDQMMINQPHIPAIAGIKGFETHEKAKIAAEYVKAEIDKGIFPPTVSEEILRDIGAL